MKSLDFKAHIILCPEAEQWIYVSAYIIECECIWEKGP